MSKTVSKQIVNGEEYLVCDAKARQDINFSDEKTMDIVKDGFGQVPYLPSGDKTKLINAYGNTYVIGFDFPFDRGYIESVSMNRTEVTTDNIVAVFITDLQRKIIRKISGSFPGTSITVPVGEYIDTDFYVFVKCDKLRFGYVDYVERTWYQVAFENNYTLKEGETMSGTWRETTTTFTIDITVNTKATEKIAADNQSTIENAYRIGEVGQPILNQISLSTLTGTSIICGSFLYPAGYVESIKMNFTSDNVNPGRVLIILIDENKKVLKKSVVYRQAGAGYQTFKIDYMSRVPFHVACYAPTLAFQSTSANPTLLKYWSGAFESYAYVREGGTLFTTWANESTPLKFDIVAVYNGQKRIDFIDYPKLPRIFTLQDAFSAWVFGEKFPIVILGDSTTDGSTTTGNTPNEIGTDHQDPNTYTTVLQANLRTALNNNVLRIYNAGFAGRNTEWLIQNIDGILWDNQYYNDAKIAVISMGINDLAMDDVRYGWYKDCLEQLITELYFNGVQPVLMTTQAGMENKTRYGWKQMSLADKLTAETAQKYNLELIDKNKYTALFNVYSDVLISSIIPDGCHYSDAGHKFVAGYLFADLVPFTVWSDEGKTILGFANEELQTELEFSSYDGYIWKDVKTLAEITNGFKLKADCSKNAETVLMDYWVFVTSKENKTLTSYCETPNVQTVIVDGVSTSVQQATQVIGSLNMGLHHITVKSGASSSVNYYGLILE